MPDSAEDQTRPKEASIRVARAALIWSIVISMVAVALALALRGSPVYLRLPVVGLFYFISVWLCYRAIRPWRARGWKADPASIPRSVAILSAVAPIAVMPALMFGLSASLGVEFLMILLLIMISAIGGVIAAVAWRHPVRCPPSCARCGYRLDSFDATPSRCPECGVGLGTSNAVTIARREPSRTLVTVGLVLLTLPLLLGASLLLAGTAAYRLAPTGALIALADESDRVWPELATRELTPEQRRTLIENIIEGPRSAYGGARGGLDYVVAEHAAGTLDPSLADRFFGDAATLSISGPSSVTAGREARIQITGGTLSLGTNLHPAVHIGPITAADGAVLLPVGETSPRFGHEFRDRATRPAFSVTLDAPGEMVLSVHVVILAQPGFWPYKVTWTGTDPAIPPEAVWHRTLVLTHEITVLPAEVGP